MCEKIVKLSVITCENRKNWHEKVQNQMAVLGKITIFLAWLQRVTEIVDKYKWDRYHVG